MVYRFTPVPAMFPGVYLSPQQTWPLGASRRQERHGDVPARNLRPGSATPAPALPGMHAALASTRGGAPALLRQNAGLDHAGRPVRAASGARGAA